MTQTKAAASVNNRQEILEYALYLASKGWSVFRIHAPIFNGPGQRVGCTCEHYKRSAANKARLDKIGKGATYDPNWTCKGQGKCPMFKGINDSTTDPEEIKKMFGETYRTVNVDTGEVFVYTPNIGIDCGKSDLLVFDADMYKETYGDLSGVLTQAEQETVTSLTGGGGQHLIYKREGKPYGNSTVNLPNGVDIRGQGGYIVAPPSMHRAGKTYEFEYGYSLEDLDPLPIPARLDAILSQSNTVLPSGSASPEEVERSVAIVEDLLEKTGLDHGKFTDYMGGKRTVLKTCPFNVGADQHGDDGSAFIVVRQDGKISAGCHHNRCRKRVESAGSGWGLLKNLVGYDKYDREDRKPKPVTLVTPPKPHVNGNGSHAPTSDAPFADMNFEIPLDTGVGLEQDPYDNLDDEEDEDIARTIVMDAEEIMDALQAIRDDTSLDAFERKQKIVADLTEAIGNLDDYHHIEIENALIDEDKSMGFTKTDAKQFIRGCASQRKKREKALEKERKKKAHDKRKQKSDILTAKYGGIEIQTNNRQIKDVGAQAIGALVINIERNPTNPLIYVKGGMLARIVPDEDGRRVIQAATSGTINVALSEVARWVAVRESANGEEKFDVYPPQAVALHVFNQPEWPGIPAIETVVNTPVFGKAGVFHTEPGYNPKTRYYYTGGVTLGDTTPTPENLQAAKDLIIGHMIYDFPFKDDASHAHAIAYMLLPFVRQMIDGPTPLHLVESPTPGTGKGKLVNACAYLSLGHDVATMSEVEDDSEWRKQLTTVLMSGRTHIAIDNINHGLDSGVFANALTQPYWSDRILGASREINVKINACWSATGNNVPISEEIARRCVLIRLDANTEKPWERTGFKHENLSEWIRENRNELVTACCIIIRNWLEKGKPRFKGKAKGSYESWTNVMGGILQAADIVGFLENESEMFAKTINSNDLMSDFVKRWWEKHNCDPITKVEKAQGLDGNNCKVSTGELFILASYADYQPDEYDEYADEETGRPIRKPKPKVEYENLLGDMLGAGKEKSRQTRLGMILAEMTDKVIGHYKICAAGISAGKKYYKLQKLGKEAQGIMNWE